MEWDLGDQRLEMRAEQCFQAIASAPDLSFPKIFRSASDQVGFYRFINNPRVNQTDIMASVEQDSMKSAGAHTTVLALHDTTQCVIHAKSKGIDEFRAKPTNPHPGFLAHVSLLVSAKPDDRQVYGPCAMKLWSRGMGVDEANRWREQVVSVEALREPSSTIHIMDREGDSYANLSQLAGVRYVVRLAHNRVLSCTERLFDFFRDKEVRSERAVVISKRGKAEHPKRARTHPRRDSRLAQLQITAQKVSFQRGRALAKDLPQKLEVNVVRVFEPKPPDGEKPIEWFLATSEPIQTTKEIECIVDYYRKRWLIEEYFKALKTGCHLEQRLLESAQAWHRVLTLFLPIATKLLNLRLLDQESLKASSLFTAPELRVLKHKAKEFKMPLKTIADAKNVIARVGGYTNKKWPPGWQVLARGYDDIRLWAEGLQLAKMC